MGFIHFFFRILQKNNMYKFFLIYILSFFPLMSLAQEGGYMGKNNLIGAQMSINPFSYYGLSYNVNSDESTQNQKIISTIITPRISYEYVLKKGFSVSADVGFKNIQVGEDSEQDIKNSVTSNLFQSSDDDVKGSFSKYYISGYDFNLNSRFYYYKKKGKIAPFGKYFGLNIGLPNYKTYYKNEIVEKSQLMNLGISFGKQGLIFGYITYDTGFRSSLTFSWADEIENVDVINDVSYEKIPSHLHTSLANIFDLYFKLAYLL